MKSISEKPYRIILIISVLLLLLGMVLAVQAQDGILPLPGDNGNTTTRLLNKTQTLIRLNYNFGSSVKLDDDWMITGSSDRNGVKMHFYQRDANQLWSERLVTHQDNLVFPVVVDLEGRSAVVGVEGDNLHNLTTSRLWAFRRNEQNQWIGPVEILRSDILVSLEFVFDLDPSGDRLVVVDNHTYGPGEVHLYEPDINGEWTLTDTLDLNQHIEHDIVLEGDTLYISGYPDNSECCVYVPDSVDVYQDSGASWTSVQILVPSNGGSNYSFGTRFAFEGDRGVVAGSVITDPNDEGNPNFSGQAYLYTFERQNGSWTEKQLLPLNEGEYVDDLRLSGDYLLVRVNADPDYGSPFHTYLYGWDGTGWQLDQQLLTSDSTKYGLGDIDGDTLAVNRQMIQPPRDFLRPPKIDFYKLIDEPVPTETPIPVTPTSTPVTPPETPVSPPEGNLIVDGGFEQDLTGWKSKHLSGDKVKCNTATKTVAYSGLCAFRFKGNAGEHARLTQIIPTQLVNGNALRLSGYVKAKNKAVKSSVQVIVTYADPMIPKDKLVVKINHAGGADYVPFSSYQADLRLTVSGTTHKVKISLKDQSQKGKVYYDELKLEVES
jgi:hypothetical protein